ncbi:hypothetical protein FOCC_FOCC003972 [Frankliniella occidentalis]|nr:hypothetical protein FOCC_FOCC003972 [Frankliniella occidentalis]
MGAQHGKERPVPQGTLGGNLGNLGNLTTRSVRSKPRPPKDGRLQGNNIFTEHSGRLECTSPSPSRASLPAPALDPDNAPVPGFTRERTEAVLLRDPLVVAGYILRIRSEH